MHIPDPQRSLFYERVFTLATVAVFVWLLYTIVEPMLQAGAWAVFLAFLMQPAQRWLARRLSGRASAAALLLTLLTLSLIVVPLTLVTAAFAAQAVELAGYLQSSTVGLPIHSLDELFNWGPARGLVDWLAPQVAGGVDAIQGWMVTGARRLLEIAASQGGALVVGAAGTLLSFTVMLFVLFFCLRDGPDMARAVMRLIPLSGQNKQTITLRLTAVTRAVVFGTVLTALIQGLLLGTGFAVTGLPGPVVFGVAGAVLSVVPFGGTAIVWVPGALWLLSQGDTWPGVFLAAWGVLVVSSVDNFLKPLFISGQAQLPTLAVFIGVLGGLSAFGLIGMFVGPIVIAVALVLLELADDSPG